MTLWVSLEEYQRLTAEDRKRWDIGIDLTRGGDWRLYPRLDEDIIEEAERYGVAVTTLIKGRP